jgi:hypothetical protein
VAERPKAVERDSAAEVILAQGLIALGQGTAGVGVSTQAASLARTLCLPVIERVKEDWARYAPEALEVVKTIGRLAATIATQDGRVEIADSDLFEAAERVVRHRRSAICLALNREMRGQGPGKRPPK